MENNDPITQEERERNIEVIGWIDSADNDYIAARVLINNGLLIQGATLSCTAIEKYLKMVHRIRNWDMGLRGDPHNLLDWYRSAKKKGLDLKLNEDYLTSLIKIYRLRYPNKIEADYNFSINQAKLLVALDDSVYAVRHRLTLRSDKPEQKRESRFDHWVSSNYNHLMRMNHMYCKEVKREDLFKVASICQEIRFVGGKNWMEAGYTAFVEDDGAYMQDGLKPGQNERQFKFQAAPIDLEK